MYMKGTEKYLNVHEKDRKVLEYTWKGQESTWMYMKGTEKFFFNYIEIIQKSGNMVESIISILGRGRLKL